MASARDLAEANAYARRRLVAAFLSGAPAGREPESARTGCTVVGGLAVAALLLAGAAVAGRLAPRDADGWVRPGLVVSDQTGASYLILEPEGHPTLHPVLDITSARLALEAGDLDPRIVAQAMIDDQVIGDAIGIRGAPAALPTPARLVQTGWTACSGSGHGLRIRVAGSPGVRRTPGNGLLVESEGVRYVVARGSSAGTAAPTAYAYRLPGRPAGPEGDEQDTMLDELGLPIRDEAAVVSAEWLALFPAGGDLDWTSFGLTGFGRRVRGAGSLGIPAGARVGDVLRTGDGSFLLTAAGPAELSDFALAVYRHVPTPRGRLATGPPREGGAPLELEVDAAPSVGRVRMPYLAAHWPAARLGRVHGPPCAELTARAGAAPTVQIATDPVGDAGVAPGRGAYVRAGGWGGRGRGHDVVVDAAGVAYPLVGAETAERLGYGATAAPVVPRSWLALFDRGVPLSVDAARAGISPAGGS
jgi:hypothetical protein